jgi:hypothetical protein
MEARNMVKGGIWHPFMTDIFISNLVLGTVTQCIAKGTMFVD